MPTCEHPKCGKRLIPVPQPDGTLSTRHPTPQCDPDDPNWPDPNPEPAE